MNECGEFASRMQQFLVLCMSVCTLRFVLSYVNDVVVIKSSELPWTL